MPEQVYTAATVAASLILAMAHDWDADIWQVPSFRHVVVHKSYVSPNRPELFVVALPVLVPATLQLFGVETVRVSETDIVAFIGCPA